MKHILTNLGEEMLEEGQTCLEVKPIAERVSTDSEEISVLLEPAAWPGAGRGSLKSASSMCANTHSIAASVPPFCRTCTRAFNIESVEE